MCGVVGFINLNKRKINLKTLESMTDSLAHRGPDGRGTHIDNFIGLGHRRLSIIDLSENAAQPMRLDQDNFVLSYNGEIYNFKELKIPLEKQGSKFRSTSDTEVVLHSLAKWGVSALNKFNGMFSLAFWDKKNKLLTIARDRYGVKPIYYWRNQNVFLFSSEIKAFLKHPEFKVNVNEEALVEYFTFQNTFSNDTLFKDVKILPPGHFMQIFLDREMEMNVKQYWDYNFEEEKVQKTKEEYTEECDKLFKQAVKRQLVSDVEIGSYLSGGIDSGSITALASQSFKNLKTFCIGFDLSSASGLELSYDERKKAEHISYLYQTEHYEMVLKSGDMQRSLPKLVWALEDLRLGQSYPNFYASKLASRFTKVCLSGAGGDELFAGYPWRYFRILKKESFESYAADYYKYWQRLTPDKSREKLFAPISSKIKYVNTGNIMKNVFSAHHKLETTRPQDYINRSLYFEAKTFLHGLLVVEDKLSMAHSLETRVPFLDNDLVDFALKLPVRFKLKNIKQNIKQDEDAIAKRLKYFRKTSDGKIILRKVLEKYVGKKHAEMQKQGFSGPDASWFKGESISYVKDMLLNKKAGIYDFFDYKTVKDMLTEHTQGKHNRRLFIWSLLNFEQWIKLFVKKEFEN